MKKRMLALLLGYTGLAYGHTSHCAAEEKTAFSCAIGKKVVSICASNNLSPSSGYMQFRYGVAQRVEVQLPALNKHPLQGAEASTYQAASGQNGSISFTNGKFTYVVYWESYRSDQLVKNGSSAWIEQAGLRKMHQGKLIFEASCANSSQGDILSIEPSYLHTIAGLPNQ